VDVIYDDTEEERNARAARGARGPEPFLYDYMKLNIEQYLRLNGFVNLSTLRDPSWDCMAVTAIKL
ncbi:MAG: hypothetical protein NZ518_11785, partial [Dehalococcoidia bacterium]|nr:hypothetical protein [Dehalococcoidia bacterium]